MTLSREDKKTIYEGVMESLYTVVDRMLNELSQATVDSASQKVAKRNLDLLSMAGNGVIRKDGKTGYQIDDAKFKKYIETVDNPKRRERLTKMYQDGTLADYLLRQQHYFATMSLNKLEWLRDNTDVPISPEFYEGTYSQGTVTDREPTKEEHDFYRYMTSMGTDTAGISHDDLVRYRNAFCRFYDETQGIKEIWNMIPEIQ